MPNEPSLMHWGSVTNDVMPWPLSPLSQKALFILLSVSYDLALSLSSVTSLMIALYFLAQEMELNLTTQMTTKCTQVLPSREDELAHPCLCLAAMTRWIIQLMTDWALSGSMANRDLTPGNPTCTSKATLCMTNNKLCTREMGWNNIQESIRMRSWIIDRFQVVRWQIFKVFFFIGGRYSSRLQS